MRHERTILTSHNYSTSKKPSTFIQSSQNYVPVDIKTEPDLLKQESIIRTKIKSTIQKAGLFSTLHFLYGIPLVRLVNSLKDSPLTVEDLEDVGYDESCQTLENIFTQNYKNFKNKGLQGASLIGMLLIKLFTKDIFFQFFWQGIFAITRICAAYFMSSMLSDIQNPNKTVQQAYYQAIGLFLSFIVAVYANHQFNFNVSYVFNKIKTGFMGMIFRKSTRLSHHALHIMSLGKIVNLNANDLNNFDKIHFLVSLVLAPLILIGGWGLLYSFWGINSFVGIGYMALLWPIQYKAAGSTFETRASKSKQTDDRTELIIEGIEGIETIKLYNWDLNLISQIKKIRSIELHNLKMANYIDSISRAFAFSSHWIASFLIYVVCVQRGGNLSAHLIFPTIYLMGFLRQLCVFNTFQAFTFLQELKLASRKINIIMDLSEVERRSHLLKPRNSENSVEFQDFSAFWVNSNIETDIIDKEEKQQPDSSSDLYQVIVSNINLKIKKGNFVAIIGNSGSGKSSILLSFTEEFAKSTGQLRRDGKYAYFAQETVFFSGPLRDSIVFGKIYDEDFFWKVLEACCLKDEIKALPNQEMTEIGEKGANLSESQKARISLARAIYSKADIYLLDECMSNLSMKLAKNIFKNCIQGLLKDKTVIMATNLLNLAKYANQIVVMEDGKIVAQGNYDELIENDENVELISALKKLPKFEPKRAEKRGYHRFASAYYDDQLKKISVPKRHEPYFLAQKKESQIINAEQDPGLFYEEETLDEWQVTYRIYWDYFRTIFSKITITPAVLLFIGTEAVSWLFTIFIAKWRKKEWSNNEAYIIIGSITFASLFVSLIKYIFYFQATLNASNKFHNKMLSRVFKSHMKFFDRNPSGRIVNRFCNDIGILDKFLIVALLEVLEGFFSFWVNVFALWTQEAWLFVSFGLLALAYFLITLWFYKTLNQTRGLELTTRSPMYSLFMIGVSGLAVVRSRGQAEDVIKTFYKKADDYSRANFAYMTAVRLMSFLMDLVIELIVIGTFAVFLSSKDTPLSSGFFVNMLGNLPSTMQWILRDFIKLHLMLTSVARAVSYCRGYHEEKPKETKADLTEFPKEGNIEIKNAQMRYSNQSDLVVSDLSLDIQAGEKIAIFGNSKSGVSSIVGMLTRLYEIEQAPHLEPFIKIDGVDIKDIDISRLRNTITVIPQNSFFLKATIRENLDPWKNYTDEEIWEALDCVGLKETVEKLDKNLETKLSKGSHVFSIGQQQLLCIARGILKKSTIFIQDEATSHLDFEGEADIQKALLKKYQNTTIINITHRLFTISKYSKVLVIENGKVIEFDEPYRLLVNKIGDKKITKEKGCFLFAVINMGNKAANEIFRNAMVSYYERHNMTLPQEVDPIISNKFFEDDSSSSEESDDGKERKESEKSQPEQEEIKSLAEVQGEIAEEEAEQVTTYSTRVWNIAPNFGEN